MNCKKCNETIPQGRADLGYSVCVECSEVEKYGCVDVVQHKTGNTIEVLSRKDAEQANKLTQRTGFGTLRSLRSGTTAKKEKLTSGKCCSTAFVGNEKSFEKVGKDCMMWVELEDWGRVTYTLQRALDKRDISKGQWNQLTKIFKEFMPKKENKVQKTTIKPIDEEISHAFKNWRNSKIYR